MKQFGFLIVLLAILSACLNAESPHMQSVSSKTAKPGDVLDVSGVALDSANVEEVFLTDHKFDMKVKVLEQSEKKLKIRVPPFAKAGRVQFMILTGGESPKLLEQPIFLVIEEENTEISAVKQNQ
jgi:hypothetical protein